MDRRQRVVETKTHSPSRPAAEEDFDTLSNHLLQRNLLGHRLARNVQSREEEQVFDHPLELGTFTGDVFESLLPVLIGELVASTKKEQGVGDHGRCWRAELMGHQSQELVLECTGCTQFIFDALALRYIGDNCDYRLQQTIAADG